MARLETRIAVVTAIERADAGGIWGRAQVEGESGDRKIIAYPTLTGPLTVGDTVLLNTTATAMNLGTGGVDFVMGVLPLPVAQRPLNAASLPSPTPSPEEGGDNRASEPPITGGQGGMLEAGGKNTEHIMKLRYTPMQHAVDAVEMGDSWNEAHSDLNGTFVVACLLHSQVALVAAGAKAANPAARIAYVMTDSAALGLGFSKLVVQLKEAGLIDATLTCGQSFGGDYECVSLPAALLAAKHVAGADVIIVAPGPGMAGTGTTYGFSGVEQAWTLDIAAKLGGRAIFCLRASEADSRERHQGISHHSRTVLTLCNCKPILPWPQGFDGPPSGALLAQSEPGLRLLVEKGITVTSMGRTVEQDPLFFHVSCAAGYAAASPGFV
ncbi:MAG: DUF3866 family protein [Armatimonas sp.]